MDSKRHVNISRLVQTNENVKINEMVDSRNPLYRYDNQWYEKNHWYSVLYAMRSLLFDHSGNKFINENNFFEYPSNILLMHEVHLIESPLLLFIFQKMFVPFRLATVSIFNWIPYTNDSIRSVTFEGLFIC